LHGDSEAEKGRKGGRGKESEREGKSSFTVPPRQPDKGTKRKGGRRGGTKNARVKKGPFLMQYLYELQAEKTGRGGRRGKGKEKGGQEGGGT